MTDVDVDEDAIHWPSTSAPDASTQVHEDISDETQDFRFINSFSLLSDATQQSLPKRGEKDFEPNPTLLQADALAGSRQAMHNAIAYPRLHNPKGRVVGVYCPDGVLVPPHGEAGGDGDELEEKDTVTAGGSGDEKGATERKSKKGRDGKLKYGVGGATCVCIPSPKGGGFKSMGQADQFNRMWLLPEEALYLLERGSLDIRWRVEDGMGGAAGLEMDQEAGIPMSLQAAYALLLGRGGLTLERYTVFAGLRRGGYAVIRAPSWDDEGVEAQESLVGAGESGMAVVAGKTWGTSAITGLFSQLFNWIYNPSSTCNTAKGPVVGLGIHRSYNDIFRALSIVPSHDPTSPIQTPPRTTAPYRLAFHVYKPSTSFRKSNPGPPDFQIAVVSARDNPTLPPLEHLSALLASTPYCPPKGEKMERLMYMRLRHGYRSVILAVVDQGVVSFLRISDAGFGREKLYAAKAPGGNKGGRRPQKKGRR